MFIRVVMKLSAPSKEPTQKMAILIIQRFIPAPCPGPALGMALKGGYAVQPPMGAPSCTKNDMMRTMKPTNVTQKESMLSTGKAMSSAPI